MDHLHADGATRTLDAIRTGGDHLVITTRQRVGAALDSLDEGEFGRAVSYLGDALGLVRSLWDAQQCIAIADGSRLVAAKDLEVGMELTHLGEVTELEVEECGKAFCSRHVKLKIGEHELEFRGEQEVYVLADDAADAEPDAEPA